ncbi:MAG TPA: hypothetical protein VD794_13470, partial [Flavisolibacter sp.]|nr:hypothetical protein [Flavisolibacter sp.]
KSKEEVQEMLIAYCKSLVPQPSAAGMPVAKASPITPSPVGMPASSTLSTSSKKQVKSSQVKHPRYLSSWKVKRNGRLHVPKRDCVTCLSTREEKYASVTSLAPPN